MAQKQKTFTSVQEIFQTYDVTVVSDYTTMVEPRKRRSSGPVADLLLKDFNKFLAEDVLESPKKVRHA